MFATKSFIVSLKFNYLKKKRLQQDITEIENEKKSAPNIISPAEEKKEMSIMSEVMIENLEKKEQLGIGTR